VYPEYLLALVTFLYMVFFFRKPLDLGIPGCEAIKVFSLNPFE
jgi:hypothetical protein